MWKFTGHPVLQGDPKKYQVENLNKSDNIFYIHVKFLQHQSKYMHGSFTKFEVYSM